MAMIKKQRIISQILIWSGIWLFTSFLLTNGIEEPARFMHRGLASLIGIAIIVLVNLNFLLPNLYFKKKLFAFVVSGIILFIVVVLLLNADFLPWADWFNSKEKPFAKFQKNASLHRKNARFGFQWMRHMIPFFIAFMGSTIVEIARYANQKEKALIQSQKEKLQSELKFLKSQINPHFLFNALNNIYTLTVIKSDKAPDNLLRLSGMLRYMLYDSNEGKVPLSKEITYLQDYINLSLLKDSRGLDISFDSNVSHPEQLVAPLLFIPFVENAFKHSEIEDLNNGHIKIDLKTHENHLVFMIENSIPKNEFTKDKVGGIGLKNVQQRLELLYPQKHTLTIHRDTKLFKVMLKLEFK